MLVGLPVAPVPEGPQLLCLSHAHPATIRSTKAARELGATERVLKEVHCSLHPSDKGLPGRLLLSSTTYAGALLQEPRSRDEDGSEAVRVDFRAATYASAVDRGDRGAVLRWRQR